MIAIMIMIIEIELIRVNNHVFMYIGNWLINNVNINSYKIKIN